MLQNEIDAFLSEPLLADLATVRPDGAPHVAPVWFHYDGDKIFIIARPSAVKLRNITYEPRVAVSISTPDVPYSYVIVDGLAEISTHGAEKAFRAMAARYKGRTEGERYVERRLTETIFHLITVTPSRFIAWTEASLTDHNDNLLRS